MGHSLIFWDIVCNNQVFLKWMLCPSKAAYLGCHFIKRQSQFEGSFEGSL